jgi:hypothetical protein
MPRGIRALSETEVIEKTLESDVRTSNYSPCPARKDSIVKVQISLSLGVICSIDLRHEIDGEVTKIIHYIRLPFPDVNPHYWRLNI